MKSRVILMGPPGAGKGTYAMRLTKAMDVPHISTGDMLREARALGTELGKQADAYMQKGSLVPDALVNGIVVERLGREDKGFLLDGFPRTIAQADALASANVRVDAVVFIDVPDDILIDRITGRLSCPKCGAVFHVRNMPPKTNGVCDACGSALMQRADDNEVTVRQRLDAYHTQTQPLVDYYEQRGLLYRINGTISLADGFDQIRRILDF